MIPDRVLHLWSRLRQLDLAALALLVLVSGMLLGEGIGAGPLMMRSPGRGATGVDATGGGSLGAQAEIMIAATNAGAIKLLFTSCSDPQATLPGRPKAVVYA